MLFPHNGFISATGLKPTRVFPVKSGRNSKVWRVDLQEETLLLKEYFQTKTGNSNRLEVEWGFLRQLNDFGVKHIAKPIACDPLKGLALYSFIEGEEVVEIKAGDIELAAAFICDINAEHIIEQYPRLFPPAADACFALKDHIQIVEKRMDGLKEMDITNSTSQKAMAFYTDCLVPTFDFIRQNVLSDENNEFIYVHPILSPSDFGFHNVIRQGEKLFFVDFEYAGWDNPVKLICDFVCQPQKPVSERQASRFIDILFQYFNWPAGVKTQAERLMPLHRLKWCLIMLNEFSRMGMARRIHAGVKMEGLLDGQLEKAVQYFKDYVLPLVKDQSNKA